MKGARLTFDAPFGSQHLSVTGTFSQDLLTLDFGQLVKVVFKRGTLAQFHVLVDRDQSILLAQAASEESRAAQSNLTNAVTEALALYQATQAYASTDRQPYGVSQFRMQAPEFTWTTGSCRAATANCISFQVLDISSDHDAQGVALAAYSSESSTCWYAIDVETTPAVVPNDPSALRSTTHSANSAVKAGVSYARSPIRSTPASCSASLVLHAHHAAWANDYSSAGGLS